LRDELVSVKKISRVKKKFDERAKKYFFSCKGIFFFERRVGFRKKNQLGKKNSKRLVII